MYDSQEKECIGEATVTLTNIESDEKFTTKTDSYGDFWFRELNDGIYSLLIDKKGYHSHMIRPVDATEKDINVGTVNLFKKE